MFDVGIIGAGPAGTAAAFDLLGSGFRVLLIDKYTFPRKKACAGGITPKGLNAFAYDISSQIKHVLNHVKITTPQKKIFYIKTEMPLCYMVDRKDLDFFSLKRVIQKGAVLKAPRKIHSIKEHAAYVEIKTDIQDFKVQYLIGADGANSIVRKYAVKDHFYNKQLAIEADVYVDRPEKYPMEFDFSKQIKGYYWIFPKDNHVNIGIYSVDPDMKFKRQALAEYAFERIGTCELRNIKGYPICSSGFDYKTGSNRILLAGDAAGMSERMLGEGIYFAVKTGRLAARSIIKSRQAGVTSVKNIYSRYLIKIQRDLKLHDMGARFLYRFTVLSLKILSIPFVHSFFAKGYTQGKIIQEMIFPFNLKI